LGTVLEREDLAIFPDQRRRNLLLDMSLVERVRGELKQGPAENGSDALGRTQEILDYR
jgi:hypothetical protein